jgi:hypothetical protein
MNNFNSEFSVLKREVTSWERHLLTEVQSYMVKGDIAT